MCPHDDWLPRECWTLFFTPDTNSVKYIDLIDAIYVGKKGENKYILIKVSNNSIFVCFTGSHSTNWGSAQNVIISILHDVRDTYGFDLLWLTACLKSTLYATDIVAGIAATTWQVCDN